MIATPSKVVLPEDFARFGSRTVEEPPLPGLDDPCWLRGPEAVKLCHRLGHAAAAAVLAYVEGQP